MELFLLLESSALLAKAQPDLLTALFVLGSLMLLAEAFVPGFGFFGISGTLLMIVSLFYYTGSVWLTLQYLLAAFVVFALFLVLLFKVVPRRYLSTNLFLKNSLETEQGFVSALSDPSLIGRTGKTLSYLHPSGKVQIGEHLFDATSEGRFIEQDKKVLVVAVQGSLLRVKEMEETA